MEILKQKKDSNGAFKRKRLDARTFKEWHITQAKKNKGIASEIKNQKFKENSSKERDLESQKKKQRIDSAENSQESPLGNGEEIPGVPEASSSTDVLSCEKKLGELTKAGALSSKQASSSTNVLCEVKHGEMMKDVALSPKQRSEASSYIEYWVPVGLSYVQLEQYCDVLIKNSNLLCSNSKFDLLDSLHEVLTMARKCCDHPYLLDSSLQKFVNDGRPGGDYLSNGIEVSGKLLLLDKLLQEVKEKQLRVLIVFQSNNSKPESIINLQHILDDLICQKIGEECYVHIYREFDSTKKRAVVDLFNAKDSGKLVMLIEKSSCLPSIKLSSMDCVILFNSDWSPINDLKPLRKMSIQSKFDHLKIFRLYSSNSVEEKALTLVKESVTLENSLDFFSYNISHKLLLWGTSYLFSKLDELHRHCSSIADMKCLSEDKLVSDVLNELSVLLSCQHSDNVSCSLISKVPEASGDISRNIALHGEQNEPARDDDLPPHIIWNSLLEGRNPLWKLLPGSSEKIRRRGESVASTAQGAECENHDGKTKRTPSSGDQFLSPKPRVGKVCRPASNKTAQNVAGYPKSRGNDVRSSSCKDDSSRRREIEETCLWRMRRLILKQKKQIREFYQTKVEDKKKLEEEHQLEVKLLDKKRGETTLKQQQLRKLDLIYEQKLDKHNHQMETKRKELEDQHLASRVKEKKLKDKLTSLLKMGNLKTLTTLLVKLSRKTALTKKPVDLIEDSSNSTIMISNASVSESNHSQEIERRMIDSSVRGDDSGICLDHELTETKGLYVERDEEYQMLSMLGEVSDSAESGTTATVAGKKRIKEVQDGDCNTKVSMKASYGEAELKDAADLDATVAVAGKQRIEEVHGGDCNIEGISREYDGETELRGAIDTVTTATVTVTAQQRIEEVQDGGSNTDAFNVEADLRDAADLGTTATVAALQRIEVQEGNCNTDWESNREVDSRATVDLGTRATVFAQQRIEEVQDGDFNTGALNVESNGKAELRGAPGSSPTVNVAAQQRIEDVLDRESNGNAELRGSPDSGTTANVVAPQRIEEVLDGESNGKAELRATPDFATSVNVAALQRIEEVLDEDCNTDALVGESNGEVRLRSTADSSIATIVAGQQRTEEVLGGDCNIEAPIAASNGEAEKRGAAGTTTSMLGQQRMVELTEFASSRLNANSKVLVQPQTCTMSGYSLPLEQPMASANLPCIGASAVSNCQTIGLHAPCVQGQIQVPLGNSGSHDQPVVQSHLQSSAGQAQPRTNSGMTIFNRPVSSYFEESSSLRSNLPASIGSDPLQIELLRMRMAEEEAVKIHEAKAMHLKSACEKEIQEIQKKYDVLLNEAENALLQKKLELGSHYKKVYANMLLAEALRCSNEKQTTSPLSADELLSAILQFSHLNLPVQSSGVTSAACTPPPVQVVNQLSELITTPHTLSTSHNTGNHFVGSHARSAAPHLCPQPSSSTRNVLPPFYGVVNQQTAPWPLGSVPSWNQPEVFPGSSLQFGGLPPDPLLL